jgi:hypothetical protein
MKMRQSDLHILQSAIRVHDTPERRARYLAGDFKGAERTKDINKRYRWDLCWLVRLEPEDWTRLYAYLNDDHIDTALRSIVAPL